MAYELYIRNTATLLGTITDDQVAELVELLEEEDVEEHDYYIDADVLAFLADEEVSPDLLEMLKKHVTADEGIEIEWREVGDGKPGA